MAIVCLKEDGRGGAKVAAQISQLVYKTQARRLVLTYA